MEPFATLPVFIRSKSVASTPVTSVLKVTVKAAEVIALSPLLPVLVLMDRALGKAGENGTAGPEVKVPVTGVPTVMVWVAEVKPVEAKVRV